MIEPRDNAQLDSGDLKDLAALLSKRLQSAVIPHQRRAARSEGHAAGSDVRPPARGSRRARHWPSRRRRQRGANADDRRGRAGAGADRGARRDREETIVARKASPSIVIGVAKAGRMVYLKALGYRNLDDRVPADADTLYGIGSNTKQFTAACILLLRDDRKLDVDAQVARYLPHLSARQRGHDSPITDPYRRLC